MKLYLLCVTTCFVVAFGITRISPAGSDSLSNSIPVAAPIGDIDKNGQVARTSVIRVACPKTKMSGSGFVHKSGRVITAEHVARGCTEVLLEPVSGPVIKGSVVSSDLDFDLAIVKPESSVPGPTLSLSKSKDFKFGTVVSTWGFPGGYNGRTPLLSVGYLSGSDIAKVSNGRVILQWVINAAFNRGNSGGPLLDAENGEVIGVVSSKLAPMSDTAISALQALSNQKSGFTYNATRKDGSKVEFSEGQVVGLVLEELRNQVQLVIGKAVVLDDLRKFLADQKIDP